MDYSKLFVCLMGMGTVFFGLVCLIALTYIMSAIVRKTEKPAPAAAPARTPAPAAVPVDQGALLAAVSAAIAEDLGTDITGIRILSIKKV